MPLQKQHVNINFAAGLDTKTDPFQIPFGKFLSLDNSVFVKGKRLQKRNGYDLLGNVDASYLTTFRGNLTAVGSTLFAFSDPSDTFISKGTLVPIDLSTLSLIRSSSNQTYVDTAVASNGFICAVFTDTNPSTVYKYAIIDSATGQNIVSPTTIASASESPRVFLLGNYFVIVYSQSSNLKYIAIPTHNISNPGSATTLVTNYTAGGTMLAFDGVQANNNLYISYNASDGGGAIRTTYLNSFLVRQTSATGTVLAAAKSADMVSVTADTTQLTATIWTSFYKTAGTTGYVVAVDANLNSVLAATQIIAAGTVLNMTSTATGGVLTVFWEVSNTYSYGSLATNFIDKRTVTQAGVLGTTTVVDRSVGLASKAFLVGTTSYMLSAYSSSYQPSYFLIDSSGNVVSRLAYSNGGGYLTLGLPSATFIDSKVYVGYLIKDLIQAANKEQNPASALPVFTQTGVNLAMFDFTSDGLNSTEIGENLLISGGMPWTYDGYQVVEQGFNVYPDNVAVTTSTAGGSITDQIYFYQAVYEWTDNQGMIHRSAPSINVTITTTGGNTSTNTIKVPTLRLTYKSLVKIVLYRWSTAQQTYYQVTSISSPTLNSTTADSVTITDTFADSSIVGNSILYTTGGVLENTPAPATNAMSLFKSRYFQINAEDDNSLDYSKQVIEATPVEMSDLLTIFVAPTVGAQGSTGGMKCIAPMDDKLCIFKRGAIYYIVGNGPDNTGANNDFSEPVFITSTVGSSNQNSIVFIPDGLMFESDKGIWLLGRDLSTTYIGAPVEDTTNEATVLSAKTKAGTNQVIFTMSNGVTLMYDYFFKEWGTFSNVSAISSTIYESLHTYITEAGDVFQESSSSYMDGSRPVLMSFTTGWINLAGLQGFQRAYFFYLLGEYKSPHKLNYEIAYDYNPAIMQSGIIQPINFNPRYGDDDGNYGDVSPEGGNSADEKWRVFFKKQKCEAFQITIREVYDPSLGQAAGAGFTLSEINMTIGIKKGYRTEAANTSTG